MRYFLFASLLLIIFSSCRTVPPSILLDSSIEKDVWYTQELRISTFNKAAKVLNDGKTEEASFQDSIIERISSRNGKEIITSKEFIHHINDKTVIIKLGNYTINNTDESPCNTCLDQEIIYRRKLSYGDVLYLTRGQHWQLAQSRNIPLENLNRLPIRYIREKSSTLKDYEKSFLNFVIATHLQLGKVEDFKRDASNPKEPSKIEPIFDYYLANKEKIWNALMENIYYEYSEKNGYLITVDFDEIRATLPFLATAEATNNFYRAKQRDFFYEIITRPTITNEEASSFITKTVQREANMYDDITYYKGNDAPFVFHLATVELNGVSLHGSGIENQTWNILDWKYSKIAYLLKYEDETIDKPIIKLAIKKQALNKQHILIYDSTISGSSLKVPETSVLNYVKNDNKGSKIMLPADTRKIKVSATDLRLIRLNMLRKRTLKKYFIIK